MSDLIRFEGISTAYRSKGRRGWRRRGQQTTALEDVSFSVSAGEILGIIGHNGSGKSTLLLTAAGIIRPARGSLHVAGPVAPYIHALLGFHRELSGRENLLLTSVLLGATRREARARYAEIAEFTELSADVLDSPLRTYSAGMIVRLGFSLVSHGEAATLLIDEVLAAADEVFRRKCVNRMGELADSGRGAVIVAHDLALIEESCHRVAVLDSGRMRFIGDPHEAVELYRQSRE